MKQQTVYVNCYIYLSAFLCINLNTIRPLPTRKIRPLIEKIRPPVEKNRPLVEKIRPPIEKIRHPIEKIRHPIEKIRPLNKITAPIF